MSLLTDNVDTLSDRLGAWQTEREALRNRIDDLERALEAAAAAAARERDLLSQRLATASEERRKAEDEALSLARQLAGSKADLDAADARATAGQRDRDRMASELSELQTQIRMLMATAEKERLQAQVCVGVPAPARRWGPLPAPARARAALSPPVCPASVGQADAARNRELEEENRQTLDALKAAAAGQEADARRHKDLLQSNRCLQDQLDAMQDRRRQMEDDLSRLRAELNERDAVISELHLRIKAAQQAGQLDAHNLEMLTKALR